MANFKDIILDLCCPCDPNIDTFFLFIKIKSIKTLNLLPALIVPAIYVAITSFLF